jgi:hypothetical protein
MTTGLRTTALCLAVALLCPSAFAQDGKVDVGVEAQADALITAGVALRREGKEREALARFEEAYKLSPSPRALGQMGLAAKSLRLYVEAERYLDGALASGANEWVEKNRAALEAARDVVAKQLGSLTVSTNVAGATLYVNGSEAGTLPLAGPLRVMAGSVRFEVRADGYTSQERVEMLPAGKLTQLHVDLEQVQAQPQLAPAATPQPAHAPATAPPTADHTPSSRRPWAYAAGAVGIVGIAVGSYFGLKTLSKKSDRDAVCPENPCPTQQGVDLDGEARDAALMSSIGFGVGIVGLSAATVLWLTEPDQPQVSAAASDQGGFVSLSGTF